MRMVWSDVTLVVLSRANTRLLSLLLTSVARCSERAFVKTVIVEDRVDSTEAQPSLPSSIFGRVERLCNDGVCGKTYSLDRAYDSVSTRYILQCEIGWELTQPGFIGRALQIFNEDPSIFQILLSNPSGSGTPSLEKDVGPLSAAKQSVGLGPRIIRTQFYRRIGSLGRFLGYGSGDIRAPDLLHELAHRLRGRTIVLSRRAARRFTDAPTLEGGTTRSPKVLFAIPVCHSYTYTSPEESSTESSSGGSRKNGVDSARVQTLRDTWARDLAVHAPYATYRFFYGRGAERLPEPDEIFLNVGDTYTDLSAKVHRMIQWAVAMGFEWIYKCDDDTWAWPDRIIRDMMSAEWRDIQYYGFRHSRGYINGGPGYVLGRRAMEVIAASQPLVCSFEDTIICELLRNAGIQPTHHPGHAVAFHSRWFPVARIREMHRFRAIHPVRPKDMRILGNRVLRSFVVGNSTEE